MSEIKLKWYLFWAAFFGMIGWINTKIFCQIRSLRLLEEKVAALQETLDHSKAVRNGMER